MRRYHGRTPAIQLLRAHMTLNRIDRAPTDSSDDWPTRDWLFAAQEDGPKKPPTGATDDSDAMFH